MRTGLILTAVALLIAGGATLLFWGSGSGESPAATSARFQDWLVRCNDAKGELVCSLSQQVVDQRSGRSVLQLSLGAAPNGKHLLGAVVPLGVSVPDGVTLQVGDATRRFAYSQCLPGGCIASLTMDDALIEKMKSVPEARLAVIDRTGKPVVMPVSLKGFGPAFDELSASKSRWWSSFLN